MSELTSVGTLMGKAMHALDSKRPGEPGDYHNEQDLLVCGKCHTPKQISIQSTIGDEAITVAPYCLCRCAKEAAQKEDERLRNEERMRRLDRLRRASLMTPSMAACTFANYKIRPENQKLHGAMQRYAEDFPAMLAANQGLILWGDVGGGKTYAAACVANALLDRGIPVYATSMVQIMRLDPYDDGDFMAQANEASLLLIDDLGAERGTDTAVERVYGVIDSRYRAGKPMLITTNLTLRQLRDTDDTRYRRIFSRVLEVCCPIEVAGAKWRLEAAADRYDAMRARLGL